MKLVLITLALIVFHCQVCSSLLTSCFPFTKNHVSSRFISTRRKMSTGLGYEIVKSESRGKIVLATRDYLPGDLVLEEKEPVIFLPAANDVDEHHMYRASFDTYMKKLNDEKKAKLMDLYGPTTGAVADVFRSYARLMTYSPDEHSPPRSLTEEEVEIFVKVTSVLRLNMFRYSKGKALFTEISRLSHSCDANCAYSFYEAGVRCRASRAVRVGEELTISYDSELDLQPTHERRHKYMNTKEFTCHCPRCNALGDDTRQFDCCDPACKGVMMVCQPINKQLVIVGLPYTGVEYVKPYLLPCTVCHLTPPPAYQAKMLALEAQLPSLAVHFRKKQTDLESSRELAVDKWQTLLEEIASLQLPRSHQLAMPIFNTVTKIHQVMFMCTALGIMRYSVSNSRAAVQSTVRDYIAAQEKILPWAHNAMYTILLQVCRDCVIEWQNSLLSGHPIFPPLETKQLLQKTMRMQLILCADRDSRVHELDVALLKTLKDMPPQLHSKVCAFCEESPLRAALTLSNCPCKQVSYCSAGCQNAHWILHKMTCKAPVTE